MTFGNSMFGDFDLKNILGNETNLFTNTDVKTILGRNIVKNYLSKIDFEIKTFGYSESSIDIIEFYEECKKNGGIVEFISNSVIKMILDEIQNMRTVKAYLKDRIFDDIEEEKAQNLENIFNNNEELSEKINQDKQDFMLQKEIRRKEIIKIQKRYNCSFEEAEKIYEAHKQQLAMRELNENAKLELKSVFSMLGDIIDEPFDTYNKKKIEDFYTQKKDMPTDVSEVDLQSRLEDDDSGIDDGFWA